MSDFKVSPTDFMQACRGIPAHLVARVLGKYTPDSIWTDCSKGEMSLGVWAYSPKGEGGFTASRFAEFKAEVRAAWATQQQHKKIRAEELKKGRARVALLPHLVILDVSPRKMKPWCTQKELGTFLNMLRGIRDIRILDQRETDELVRRVTGTDYLVQLFEAPIGSKE